jgi:threonine aldolase
MFCLSKGLAAPVGSVLVGTAAFIERARSVRKMLGGGMRQAGVLAAAGLIALEKMPARLAEDHRNARLLAELLDGVRGLDLAPTLVRTNILVVGIEGTGMESAALAARLAAEGVLFGTIDPKTIRMLTHLDVSEEQVRHAARAFERVLGRKAAGETAARVS